MSKSERMTGENQKLSWRRMWKMDSLGKMNRHQQMKGDHKATAFWMTETTETESRAWPQAENRSLLPIR